MIRPGRALLEIVSIIPDSVRQQLKARFEERLGGPVRLTFYTRPGSSRLILPSGYGCATCEEAREMAELLRDSAPEKVSLTTVDISKDVERARADGIQDVPLIAIAPEAASPDPKAGGGAGAPADHGGAARIQFLGLPTGTEFPALIDAVERASTKNHGLSQESLANLERLASPLELMVFATPT
jgi:hypothetical protein